MICTQWSKRRTQIARKKHRFPRISIPEAILDAMPSNSKEFFLGQSVLFLCHQCSISFSLSNHNKKPLYHFCKWYRGKARWKNDDSGYLARIIFLPMGLPHSRNWTAIGDCCGNLCGIKYKPRRTCIIIPARFSRSKSFRSWDWTNLQDCGKITSFQHFQTSQLRIRKQLPFKISECRLHCIVVYFP